MSVVVVVVSVVGVVMYCLVIVVNFDILKLLSFSKMLIVVGIVTYCWVCQRM